MNIHSDDSVASRGYTHVEMLSLEPVQKETHGGSVIFIMGQAQATASIGDRDVQKLTIPTEIPSHLDETIAQLVEEKRSDLLALASMGIIEGQLGGERPEIHIHDKGAFNQKIREISAHVTGEDSRKVRALVTQRCLKELWPVLCLDESLKKLEATKASLAKGPTRAIPKGRISKQVKGAVKTTALFLQEVGRLETLTKSKIEEKAWETQKLLAKNESLQTQLNELQKTSNEASVRNDVQKLETQVKQFLEEGRNDKEYQTSWLGSLFDQGAAWVKWLIPTSIQNVVSDSSQKLAEGLQSQEQRDRADFQFLQHHQEKIDAFYERAQILTDRAGSLNPKPTALCTELEKLAKTLKQYHDVTEYLDDYFVLDEAQESATMRLTDQRDGLERGKCDFSADAYIGMVRQIQRFGAIGSKHKKQTQQKRLIEEIDKKTAYQNQQCLNHLEEFMEELLPAMRAESTEATAQWDRAYKRWVDAPSTENYSALLSANIVREAVTKACADFGAKLKTLRHEQLPDAYLTRCQKDLQQMSKLHKELSELPAPPERIAIDTAEAFKSQDISEYLSVIRNDRVTISKAQQKRELQLREFEKLEEDGPPSRQLFLRSFFFYLQALHPVVEAFSTPIAKQDFDFCLKMMAKTSQSANPTGESYDHYLNMARSFIGIDEEFLNSYDQFLRGQMQFSYNPKPVYADASAGMLSHGNKTTAETIYEWVEGVAPSGVAAWTASLLGLSSEGHTKGDSNAWDQWVTSNIYPQVKENYFSGVVNYFEQLGPSAEPTAEGDAALFGYHCHQMYQSLKSAEGQQAFQAHQTQAAQFPQFRTFLKDYQDYLQMHVPQVMVEPIQVHTPLEHVVVLSLSPMTANHSPQITGNSVVNIADKTNQVFGSISTTSGLMFGLYQGPINEENLILSTTTIEERPSEQPHIGHKAVTTPKLDEQKRNVQALKSLIEGPLLEVSEKDLLHVVGDPFGLGTGLEGSTPEAVLKFRLGLLHAKLNALKGSSSTQELYDWAGLQQIEETQPEKDITQLIEQLEQTLKLHRAIRTPLFSDSLAQTMRSAESNRPILLPGGWTGTPEGHAIYYEFTKQNDGRFAVRIYNTGAGVNYHPQHTERFKSKAVTFIEQINVSIENILNPSFIKALQELANMPPEGITWGEKDIYGTILTALGGDPSPITYTEDDLRTPQRAGTCAFMSLATALSYRMDSAHSFLKFEFEGEFKALVDFVKINQAKIEQGEEQPWRLLSKSLAEFSRDILEFHQRGIINDSEKVFAAEKVRELQDLVDKGQNNVLAQAREKAPIVSLDFTAPTAVIGKPTNVEVIETPTKELPKATITPKVIPVQNWVPTAANLQADLINFNTQMQVAFSNKDYVSVLATLDTISEKLPFTRFVQGDFVGSWKKLSPDQLGLWSDLNWETSEAVIHSLTAISKLAFQSQLLLTRSDPSYHNELSPKRFVAFFKLFTISQQLATQPNAPFKVPDRSFISSQAIMRIQEQSMFFRTYDPSTDYDIQQLANYWNRESSQSSGKPELWGDVFKGNFGVPPSFSMNPGYEWIDKILTHPRYRSAFKSRFPEFANTTEGAQLAISLGDVVRTKDRVVQSPRDLLPPLFYDLHDLMYLTQFLAQHRIEIPEHLEQPFDFTYEAIQTGYSASYWDLKPNYPGQSSGESLKAAHSSIENKHLQNLITRSYDPDKFNRNPLDTQLTLNGAPFSDWPVTLEERRHLMALTTDPDLQVKETLVYFMSPLRAKLLTQPDYQVLFNSLFFQPGLLLQELQGPQKDTEHFIHTTANFFQSRYETYAKIGQWRTASFYLSLNRQFKNYVDYCMEQHGLTISTPLATLDILSEIPLILENTNDISDEGMAFLNLELALAYTKLNDVNDAAQFLSAVIAYDLRRESLEAPPGREKELALDAVKDQLREDLLRLSAGPLRDQMLNQIAKTTRSGFQTQPWRPYPEFPRFIAADSSCAIDVLLGKIYEISATEVHLNSNIYRDPLFENVFGKGFNPKASKIGPQMFEFSGPDGDTYRVGTEESNLIIQRSLERVDTTPKRWFDLFTGESVIKQRYQLVAPNQLKQLSTNQALLLDNTHWYAVNEILIYRPDSTVPNYQIKPISQDQENFEVHLLDSSGNATTGLILSNAPLPFLDGFEDPKFVLKWASKDGKVEALELPRFHLNFTVNEVQGERKAFCDKMPGYALAKKQWIPALGDYPNALILEKSNGEQKVLLPNQVIKADENRNGSLETRRMTIDREVNNHSQTYHEYSVNKATGQLIPSNDSGRFYLAMLHLWKMDYSQAMTILRGYEASLRPFDPDEVAMLTQITELKTKSQDNDPRALVVYLYATYLLKKNAIDFPQANIEPYKPPIELISQYLSVAEKTAEIDLKPQEEALLLYDRASSSGTKYRLQQVVKASNLNEILNLPEVASSVPIGHSAVPHYDRTLDSKIVEEKGADFLTNLKLNRLPEKDSIPSILNPPFDSEFATFYQMASGSLSSSGFREAYQRVTGVSLPWKEELNQPAVMRNLFQMAQEATLRQPQNNPKVALAILRIVNEAPSRFPSLNSIERGLNNYYSLSEAYQKDVITPALEIANILNPRIEASNEQPDRPVTFKEVIKPLDLQQATLPFEQCVAPYASSTLAQPIIDDLSVCIHRQQLPSESMDQVYSELNAVFDVPNLDRVVNNEFKRIQDNLSTYREKNSETTALYSLHDPAAFAKMRGDLEATITQGNQALNDQVSIILEMANKRPTTELGMAHYALEAIGEGKTAITIDQLANLFLLRDRDRFHQANPELTEEDIYALNHSIMEYLVRSTHIQHLTRLAAQMKGIQDAISNGISEEDLSQKIQDFSQAAASTRAYTVEDHPEYLVIEHYMDILMRGDQVANLDLLRIHDGQIDNPDKIGVVLEMIMGSGKTDVLLPILGQLNADGDSLSIGILPEALLPSMVQRLTERLGTSFEQSVEVLNFNRDQNLDKSDLTMLKWHLEHVRTDRRMLFMTSSTIQSLFLTFVETWQDYASATPEKAEELGEKLDVLRDIFRIFKEKGRVILDESDLILNSRKEYHFTAGAPQVLPVTNIDMSCSLYQMLLDPTVVGNIHFDFVSANRDAPPFTPQEYKEKIAPKLVDSMLKNKLGVSDPVVDLFFNELSVEQRTTLTNYLSNKKDPEAIQYVAQISEPLIKDLLALAKEQINVLIPLTVNKLLDEHYGPSANSAIPIAIPYHGSNNPAEKSRYGEYETLNYTIQLFIRKGISSDIVKQEIEDLQHELIELNKRGIPYLGSETHNKFLKISGGDPQFHLFASGRELEKLTESINKSVDLKLHFAKKYALPHIVSYPTTYSANPQIYNYLFAKVFGFSGTQWNADTFPDKLQVIGSDVATAKTLALLWKNSDDKVYVLSQLDPAHLAETLIGNNAGLQNTHALIDTAASGRGISNEMHAKQLLLLPSNINRQPPVNGVVFYDAEDHLMILERSEEKPKPFEHTTLPIEQRCTFYDQKHTTGSDIKQPFGSSAVVTIGKHTILRDVLQSVWRMRGLDRGQHVEFAIDEDVKQILSSTLEHLLGEKVTEPIELKHLLLFVTYNQAMQQGDNNFRSLKQKMKAILQETVLLAALDKKVPVTDIKEMFQEVEELFVTRNSTSTWEMFGYPQEERDSKEVVDDLVNTTLESRAFQGLSKDPTLAAAVDVAKVEKSIKGLAKKSLPILPDQLPAVDRRYGIEAELESEKEKQTQSELQLELEKDTSLYDNVDYVFVNYPLPEPSDIQQWDFFSETSVNTLINKLKTNHPSEVKTPFIALSQALTNEPSLEQYKTVFDSRIVASMQLIRQTEQEFMRQNERPEQYALFNYFQKASGDILIVQNKESEEVKFVLLDSQEALHFRKLLESDAKTMKNDGQTRLCLYRSGLGPYRQGSDRIDIDTMRTNSEFLGPLVQAKFFSGEVDYTDEEIPVLEAWVKTQGVNKMERLFNRIVEWKSTTQQALPTSTLGGIFRNLQPNVASR